MLRLKINLFLEIVENIYNNFCVYFKDSINTSIFSYFRCNCFAKAQNLTDINEIILE